MFRRRTLRGYGFGEDARVSAIARAPIDVPLSMQPPLAAPAQAACDVYNVGEPAARPTLTSSESAAIPAVARARDITQPLVAVRYESGDAQPTILAAEPSRLLAAGMTVRDAVAQPAAPLDSSQPIVDAAPSRYEMTEANVPSAPSTTPYVATGTSTSSPSCLSPGLSQTGACSGSGKTLLLVGGAVVLGLLLFGRK